MALERGREIAERVERWNVDFVQAARDRVSQRARHADATVVRQHGVEQERDLEHGRRGRTGAAGDRPVALEHDVVERRRPERRRHVDAGRDRGDELLGYRDRRLMIERDTTLQHVRYGSRLGHAVDRCARCAPTDRSRITRANSAWVVS